MGVLLFNLLFNLVPFKKGLDNGLASIKEYTENKEFNLEELINKDMPVKQPILQTLSTELKDLFKKIFLFNPNNRISIEELNKHPWVMGGKISDIVVPSSPSKVI